MATNVKFTLPTDTLKMALSRLPDLADTILSTIRDQIPRYSGPDETIPSGLVEDSLVQETDIRDDGATIVIKVSGGDNGMGKTAADVANFLIKGTKDHGPVTAKYLRFFGDSGAIYAKRVRGITPHSFTDGVDDTVQNFLDTMWE